jgi:DeoR/GlpR family transcriptional regulator of sugar metabolism
MKVANSVIQARRKSLADLLQNRYLPLAEVCTRFGISEATARRDLRELVREKKITRTYGGALGTFDATFTSFADRRAVSHEVKSRLAQQARKFIQPGMTCFFDSGTTIYALAEELYREPIAGLRAVTNSLPVAEILGRASVEVHLLGGRFLQRQSILLGPAARRSARGWKFDLVFMGAEGFSRGGVWASEPEVALFQKALLPRAREVIVCAHAEKLDRETGVFLTPWTARVRLVTDASPARRARSGVPLQ